MFGSFLGGVRAQSDVGCLAEDLAVALERSRERIAVGVLAKHTLTLVALVPVCVSWWRTCKIHFVSLRRKQHVAYGEDKDPTDSQEETVHQMREWEHHNWSFCSWCGVNQEVGACSTSDAEVLYLRFKETVVFPGSVVHGPAMVWLFSTYIHWQGHRHCRSHMATVSRSRHSLGFQSDPSNCVDYSDVTHVWLTHSNRGHFVLSVSVCTMA